MYNLQHKHTTFIPNFTLNNNQKGYWNVFVLNIYFLVILKSAAILWQWLKNLSLLSL